MWLYRTFYAAVLEICCREAAFCVRKKTYGMLLMTTFSNAILCTALPVYHKEYAEVCSAIILDTFKQCNDLRCFGACAPELCYIAMGRCELYFEYLLSPWDFAAASLIVTEAGGVITSADGNALNFNKPTGIVAANNPENHQRMVEIVTAHTA